ENPSQIICGVAIIWIKRQRLLPLFDGLARAPDTGQGGAKIITRVRIIRLNFEASLPVFDRFIDFALSRQSNGQPIMGCGIAAAPGKRLAIASDWIVCLTAHNVSR